MTNRSGKDGEGESFQSQSLGCGIMTLTRHSEGHHRSDLPLEAVGGDAHVVAGVAAGDFGEDELAAPLLNAGR